MSRTHGDRSGSGEVRAYRSAVAPEGLVLFDVAVDESDLRVAAERDLREDALAALRHARGELTSWLAAHPGFEEALEPVDVPASAPGIVRRMAGAAALAGTGPMAAVAGAVAEAVGESLAPLSPEVIVENGGDIYLSGSARRMVAVFAGRSPLSMKVAIAVEPGGRSLGIAASSATVGPSISFGSADASVIVARNATLADAVATALGNRVRSPGDLEGALAWALSVEGVLGALVILGERLAARGEIELAPAAQPDSMC